jgi:hypothetical protein
MLSAMLECPAERTADGACIAGYATTITVTTAASEV